MIVLVDSSVWISAFLTPKGRINKYLELLMGQSLLVAPPGAVKFCRDPHDDHILETALIAKAEHIITRDDDLKGDASLTDLFSSFGVKILSVRQALTLLS